MLGVPLRILNVTFSCCFSSVNGSESDRFTHQQLYQMEHDKLAMITNKINKPTMLGNAKCMVLHSRTVSNIAKHNDLEQSFSHLCACGDEQVYASRHPQERHDAQSHP